MMRGSSVALLAQRRAPHVAAQSGFTIVELLIVVVVIAILAAITIVSYNGVTQKARNASAQSAVQTAVQKIMAYAVNNNDTYPADLASVGVMDGSSVSYQYSANNVTSPAGYCVTALASGVPYYAGFSYTYTDSSTPNALTQTKPTAGACPGHSSTGAAVIVNLATNPGVEANLDGYDQPNGSTIARDTARSYQGAASVRTTMPVGAPYTVGVTAQTISVLGGADSLQPNRTYTFSAYVYAPAGTPDPYLDIQGSGRGAKFDPTSHTTALKNQWVRLYNVFTTNASGQVVLYVLNKTATTAGQQYWVDNMMISEGVSTPYTYADGNSSGWIWKGAQHNAVSTGPAI